MAMAMALATTELVEIQPPHQLNFTFEVKKQSSCAVQLINNTPHYVAFKVKTTSPKKYCVRPNIGVIKPRSTCDFTVVMQAQRVAPPDLRCKDKFLIQSTIAPFGITEEEITSDMFVKDFNKHIQEKKLKVVLQTPPSSPILFPLNGEAKLEFGHEASLHKEKVIRGVENIPPPFKVSKPEDLDGVNADNSRVTKNVEGPETVKEENELVQAKNPESGQAKAVEGKIEVEEEALKFSYDFEKSTLKEMYSKLKEAEHTIMKLMKEKSVTTREKDTFKQELVSYVKEDERNQKDSGGFPLPVCMPGWTYQSGSWIL
ncbi:hypothetical protein ACFE04_012073 [Oxalis oulophora]